jgi:hypothetical protein
MEEYKVEEVSAPNRDKVELLGETYEKGKPEGEEAGKWRQKLENRADKLKYLSTAERYWYGKDWFGSEKRKNPA